mgnify:CR=1 FL=1
MAALVLVACSKSDDDATFYGVKAELDGIELEIEQSGGMVNTTTMGESLTIYAYSADNEGFIISLGTTTETGTYDLADSEVNMTYVKDYMSSDYYSFDSGTMTITKFEHGDDEHGDDEHGDDEHGDDEHGDDEHGDDEHGDDIHFKATFSGEASPNMGEGTAVVITEGEIEIEF